MPKTEVICPHEDQPYKDSASLQTREQRRKSAFWWPKPPHKESFRFFPSIRLHLPYCQPQRKFHYQNKSVLHLTLLLPWLWISDITMHSINAQKYQNNPLKSKTLGIPLKGIKLFWFYSMESKMLSMFSFTKCLREKLCTLGLKKPRLLVWFVSWFTYGKMGNRPQAKEQ